MAVKTLSPFYPRGPGLQNGEKLNRIFGYAAGGTIGVAPDQVPALNVKNLTVTSATNAQGNGLIAAMTPVPVQATSAAVGPAIPLAIPAGATVQYLTMGTSAAFTGATVSGCVGSTSGDASYVGNVSVKNGGTVQLLPSTAAGVTAFASVPTGSGLVFTLSQGTPTATGSGTINGGYTI